MKWYYIIYQHQYSSKTGRTQEWSDNETITNTHPIEFLLNLRDKYKEDEHATYRYRLLFWAEILEEIALKFKERLD